MPKTLIIDDDIPEYMINDFKYAMERELRRQQIFKMDESLKIFLKAQREANKQQREADKQQREAEREADKQQREAERDLKMTMIEKKALRKVRDKQRMEEAKRQIQEIEKKNKSNKIKPKKDKIPRHTPL